MGWDALAGGAIILPARNDGCSRETEVVVRYAKTGHEQVYSGARNLRLELDRDVPPARPHVETLLDDLEQDLDTETRTESTRVAREMLEQVDAADIGLRTSRHTVVAAADRVTPGKTMTQMDVVEAGARSWRPLRSGSSTTPGNSGTSVASRGRQERRRRQPTTERPRSGFLGSVETLIERYVRGTNRYGESVQIASARTCTRLKNQDRCSSL